MDATTQTFIPATAAQLSFVSSLLRERIVPDEHADFAARLRSRIDGGTLDKGDASAAIEWLKRREVNTTPAASVTAPEFEVPAGRYAIEVDGTVKFYRVDRPTEGRWAGYTFVKVQASDDLYPVRGASAQIVLDAIRNDGPLNASVRYGRAIGACGRCGRTLTDADSIANGIGPICASKF